MTTEAIKSTPAATNGKTTPAPASTTPAAPGGLAAPVVETPKPDPFANLPLVKIGEDDKVLDMSGIPVNNPFKYAKVQEDGAKDKLPIMRGWKHGQAVFIPGTYKGGENGFKAGSVYGTIADIVTRAGRSGITAQDLVTQVRQRQIGNKRSKYCEKLPPLGWAEGWVNTAVTKNIIGVHATKRAPALVIAPAVDTPPATTPALAAPAADAKKAA
jgi:hypothetical protein